MITVKPEIAEALDYLLESEGLTKEEVVQFHEYASKGLGAWGEKDNEHVTAVLNDVPMFQLTRSLFEGYGPADSEESKKISVI